MLIISFKHNSLAAHVCSPHKLHDSNGSNNDNNDNDNINNNNDDNNNNNNNNNNKIDSKTDRKTLKLYGLKNFVRNMRP